MGNSHRWSGDRQTPPQQSHTAREHRFRKSIAVTPYHNGVVEQREPVSGQEAATGYVQADAPIERRSDDRLQRAPLAEAISDQVVHGPKGQGLVIGIVGKWGSGKTSLLKMVDEAVRESSESVILTFNPWLFSGTDQLVVRFLEELAAQLRGASNKAGASATLGRAAERLSAYAESLEPLSWLPMVGALLARVAKTARMLRTIRKVRSEQPSVEQQRESVRKVLQQLEQRVLVLIDDLDRIEPAQIRDMVRLIKLVGDFPNVTYLLSYDRGPVERALGDTRDEGATYLEKIVQVVHDLPEPPPEAIQRILLEELQVIVEAIQTGPFWVEDWQNILPGGLLPFFRTLRDVRRYLNAIHVSLRVVGEEVALVDVLALEAFRVFVPKVYEEISASVGPLTGEGGSQISQPWGSAGDGPDARRVTAILDAAGEFIEPTKEILLRLFPSIGHLVGGSRMVSWEQEARRRLRVAHPDILRTYLRRALPPGVVSGALVGAAVDSLGDPDRLSNLFEGLDSERVEALIARIEDYEHEYDPATVETALPVLLNQIARLREGRRSMMDFGAELVVGRVVLRMLRRIDDEGERLAIVERVLPAIEHLTGRMELIDTVGHRENVGHRLCSQEASDRLYQELRTQVMEASPAQLAQERGIVHLFVRMMDDPNGRQWIRDACLNDEVFLQLLRGGFGEQRSQTMGDYAVQSRPSLPWELYQEWIGDAELRQRVQDVAARTAADELHERTRAALEAAERYATGELTNERWRS
jgi:predicted KAP-like P-loop ATPase